MVALSCAHEASWDDAWLSPFGHARVHPRHTGGTTHPYYTTVFLLIIDADKDAVAIDVAPFGPDGTATTMPTTWADDTGVGDIGAATTPADACEFEILDLQIASLRTTSPAGLIGSIGSK